MRQAVVIEVVYMNLLYCHSELVGRVVDYSRMDGLVA